MFDAEGEVDVSACRRVRVAFKRQDLCMRAVQVRDGQARRTRTGSRGSSSGFWGG